MPAIIGQPRRGIHDAGATAANLCTVPTLTLSAAAPAGRALPANRGSVYDVKNSHPLTEGLLSMAKGGK